MPLRTFGIIHHPRLRGYRTVDPPAPCLFLMRTIAFVILLIAHLPTRDSLLYFVCQALIARVAREVEAESGVDLEQLINPSKVTVQSFD